MDFQSKYVAERFMMGLMIYREAGGEPFAGQAAVGYTVLNRADHPGWWGNDPYSVLVAPKQYSSLTYLGDVMTVKYPLLSDPVFQQCLRIGDKVLDRLLDNPAPGADSYYAAWMDKKIDPKTGEPMTPKWVDPKKFVIQVGGHKFYNLDGDPVIVQRSVT